MCVCFCGCGENTILCKNLAQRTIYIIYIAKYNYSQHYFKRFLTSSYKDMSEIPASHHNHIKTSVRGMSASPDIGLRKCPKYTRHVIKRACILVRQHRMICLNTFPKHRASKSSLSSDKDMTETPVSQGIWSLQVKRLSKHIICWAYTDVCFRSAMSNYVFFYSKISVLRFKVLNQLNNIGLSWNLKH